jgi:hypothetical protein
MVFTAFTAHCEGIAWAETDDHQVSRGIPGRLEIYLYGKCYGIYMDHMGFHGILWDFGFSGNDMDRNWDLVGFRWDLTKSTMGSPIRLPSNQTWLAGKSLNWAFEWIG